MLPFDADPGQCRKPRAHCDSVSIESILVNNHRTCGHFTSDFSLLELKEVFLSV
jgi:hypothetical protein